MARDGSLAVADPGEAAETFINLLIGDLQIRRVIGVAQMPNQSEMTARGARAVAQIRLIFDPDRR